MITKRIVVGTKTRFFRAGDAITVPAADTGSIAGPASATNKPAITDPKWVDAGQVKWKRKNTGKTEEYMEACPGSYQVTEEVTLSKGMKFTGNLEKLSNLLYSLLFSAPSMPLTGVGGVFNPLAGGVAQQFWIHKEERDQNDTLVNVVDVWVSVKPSGDSNTDEKPSELAIEATLLYSPLNVGNLA